MNRLSILSPGLATSVQDLGRPGGQRIGVPVSGALDPEAHTLANALVGNPPDAAAIELRFLGPRIRNDGSDPLKLAIVGAEFQMTLTTSDHSVAVIQDRSFDLVHGAVLEVGPLSKSSTATLAIGGGIDVPAILGSRSTFLRSGFGGHHGRYVQQGDVLKVGASDPQPDRMLKDAFDLTPPRVIRVVLGPQDDHFTPAAIRTFLEQDWTISKAADRMGLRLEGPQLEHTNGFNIVSDGIVTGAIQVPGNGQPILLLADRGTAGGYPKIASVITSDLPALGRMAPGGKIRFQAVSAADGARIARARHADIQKTIEGIMPYQPDSGLDLKSLYEQDLISPPELGD